MPWPWSLSGFCTQTDTINHSTKSRPQNSKINIVTQLVRYAVWVFVAARSGMHLILIQIHDQNAYAPRNYSAHAPRVNRQHWIHVSKILRILLTGRTMFEVPLHYYVEVTSTYEEVLTRMSFLTFPSLADGVQHRRVEFSFRTKSKPQTSTCFRYQILRCCTSCMMLAETEPRRV